MTLFHWVRHGQSEGNLAAAEAKAFGKLRLDIPWDTHDIPLTQEGIHQAMALKGKLPEAEMVFTSPLLRARQTLHWAMPDLEMYIKDGRLIDKESGVFDKLSVEGMKVLEPEAWAERQRQGKFYHRPPKGESWLDVALRVQSFMNQWAGRFESVLVFSHDVTILCAVYVALGLTADEILDYQKNTPVKNGSITTLDYGGGERGEDRRVRLVASS